MARIAIVGPTHPWPGGISHHTTWLAHRLRAHGHDVALLSWSAQYPATLYKSEKVPEKFPDVPVFAATSWPLSWNKPGTWLAVGSRVRSADLLILVTVTPYHAIPYRTLLSRVGRGPRRLAIMHNVLPHEAGPLDRTLVKVLIRSLDRVMAHGESQRQVAATVGARPDQLLCAPLPPFPPGRHPLLASESHPLPLPASGGPTLLFFGIVRPYKGLDLLLRALAAIPGVRLIVAGQFWEDVTSYSALIGELGLTDRVTLRPGYVAADDIADLFVSSSALVLPYRSATGSQMVHTAFQYRRPVLVTDVGELAKGVRDGVDGVVVPAPTVMHLTAGLRRLVEPGALARFSAAIPADDTTNSAWDLYLNELERILPDHLRATRPSHPTPVDADGTHQLTDAQHQRRVAPRFRRAPTRSR